MSKFNKLITGVGWGALSTMTVALFQIVFMGVMARLLSPADFGLVAIANLSLRFLSYFAQMGVSPALVQKPQLESDDIPAALSVSFTVSLLAFLIIVIFAPLVSTFFAMKQLTVILQVLAVGFLINGFSAVSLGLLGRSLSYKYIAVIDASSYLIGYGVVGLTMAWCGYGVWALVGSTLAQYLVTAVLGYYGTRHPLSLKHSAISRKHFIAFGGNYSVIGFLEFISFNLDAILIGKFMGEALSGLYNRALVIANLPIQQPSTVITKALFPFLSSLSQDKQKQEIGAQLSLLVIGGYAFAVSFGVSAAAKDIVAVLLGSKWNDAAPILAIFVLSVGPSFVSHAIGVTLNSMGELKVKIRLQVVSLTILTTLMLVSFSHGVIAIATAVAISEWLRMIGYFFASFKLLNIRFLDLLRIVCFLFVLAALSYSCIFTVSNFMLNINAAPIFRLGVDILAGSISIIIAWLVTRSMLSKLEMMTWVLSKMPKLAIFFPKTQY